MISSNTSNHSLESNNIHKELEISQIRLCLTDDCTNDCKYCFVKKGKNYMTDEVLNEALNILMNSNEKNKKITIFGGEPTLAFGKIKELITLSKRKAELTAKNVEFSIATNGTNITKDQIFFFSKEKIKVSISIDGKKETHDEYRKTKQGEPTYDKVVKNLILLQKRIPKQDLSCLFGVHPSNADKMYENFMHIIDDLHIDNVNIEPIQNITWSTKEAASFKSNLTKILNELLLRLKNKKPFFINYINLMIKEKQDNKIKIFPLYRNLIVFPNGEITDNALAYYTKNKTTIGNVYEKKICPQKNKSTSQMDIINIRNSLCGEIIHNLIKESKQDQLINEYIRNAVQRVFE